MTPADRDWFRANATMQILAAMYVSHIPRVVPRDETEEQTKSRERADNIRRMERALEAANQADAMLAELELREEVKPDPLMAKLLQAHPGGIPAGGNILSCKHGRASFEECADCDAADAAEKAAAAGGGGQGGENRQN